MRVLGIKQSHKVIYYQRLKIIDGYDFNLLIIVDAHPKRITKITLYQRLITLSPLREV